METQLKLNEKRLELRDKVASLLPDVWSAREKLASEVYKDGALSCKVKRLMSLAVALGVGCQNCILAQSTYALETGATQAEILETLSVVVSMRGTTGVAESMRVVQFLDELGKL
jgi:AhpD family alkylhydroperoxidase